jgi:hypothetical protein
MAGIRIGAGTEQEFQAFDVTGTRGRAQRKIDVVGNGGVGSGLEQHAYEGRGSAALRGSVEHRVELPRPRVVTQRAFKQVEAVSRDGELHCPLKVSLLLRQMRVEKVAVQRRIAEKFVYRAESHGT